MVETMEESAQPIPNAQISVFRRDERGSVFIKEYRTNESGRTQRIELDAPDSSHSTDIHSLTRPYGQYDIHVAKEGFDTEIRNGVQIFARLPCIWEDRQPVHKMLPLALSIISRMSHPVKFTRLGRMKLYGQISGVKCPLP